MKRVRPQADEAVLDEVLALRSDLKHYCIHSHVGEVVLSRLGLCIIIIIIPCKPYLSASATAPHPLGRRKVERLFSLFSV
jgi:hypothetical protein